MPRKRPRRREPERPEWSVSDEQTDARYQRIGRKGGRHVKELVARGKAAERKAR